jgi:subtilase family serine protease
VVNAGDLVLGSRSVPGLAAGVTSKVSTSLVIPVGIAPGVYWLLAVADAGGGVAERNETNNLTSVAISIQ